MKWKENELEQVIALANEGKTNKEIAIIVGRTARSIERRLIKDGYLRKKPEKKNVHCKECNNVIDGFGEMFCSRSCAATYTNKTRDRSIYDRLSRTLSEQHVKQKNSCRCIHCNDEFLSWKKVIVCDVCSKWSQNIPMFKSLGCYERGVKLSECNIKALSILSDLYFNKKYSKPEIKQLVGVDTHSLFKYFKKNGISLRNGSEALSNAFENGRSKLPHGHPHYKCGWHTSWQGRHVYYRSSYELKYCLFLDDKRIPYEMEFKRFLYYDTQEKKNRFAVPDFYLPLENRIVEVKGEWTYDPIEMEDKKKVYVEAGYAFTLLREDELRLLGIDIK